MTTAPAPPRKLTVEDLLAMPDGDEYELVDGELRIKGMGVRANRTASISAMRLELHMPSARGYLLIEQQYAVFLDPELIRRPDLSYFRPTRLPAYGERIPRMAPDFVIEITSPPNSAVEERLKVAAWLDAGVEMVWVLLPEAREVTVYQRSERPEVFRAEDTITGGDVLPGFSVLAGELFPALEPDQAS